MWLNQDFTCTFTHICYFYSGSTIHIYPPIPSPESPKKILLLIWERRIKNISVFPCEINAQVILLLPLAIISRDECFFKKKKKRRKKRECWHRFWARVQDGRIRWQYVVYRMSCRWGWLPIMERSDVTKFTGDDVSMPMTMMRRSADDHGKRVCRWYGGGVWKLLIGLWKSFNLSRGITELFPYLFKSFCIRIPCHLEF